MADKPYFNEAELSRIGISRMTVAALRETFSKAAPVEAQFDLAHIQQLLFSLMGEVLNQRTQTDTITALRAEVETLSTQLAEYSVIHQRLQNLEAAISTPSVRALEQRLTNLEAERMPQPAQNIEQRIQNLEAALWLQ